MFVNKEEFKRKYSDLILQKYGRPLEESHKTEKFIALEELIRREVALQWSSSKTHMNTQKQMYYFSMEFLMGRMLTNNLMNLNAYDDVKDALSELGVDINELEELESDQGLGNGGLGRLAACFLDSLASLGYPGHGNTIRYKYGLFKQKIIDGYQVEIPDQWMHIENSWEVRKVKHQVDISYWGHVEFDESTSSFKHVNAEKVVAVPYDMPIIGKDEKIVNTLRMWDAEVSEDILVNKDFRTYSNEVNEICQTLYPDDSSQAGKILRLKQQYFFVSAGIQTIVKAHLARHHTLDNFAKFHVIQLNDTHPVLAIPEFMRILVDEHHYEWQDAWEIVRQSMAYTNHTLLSEALEKWPIDIFRGLLPRIYMIVEEINRRFIGFVKECTGNDESIVSKVVIIKDGQIHMAHLAIVGSFSVNGVAKIHSDLLKCREMVEFSRLYPYKFNNKTNGVTHRRWLAYCNKPLKELLNDAIGDSWIEKPNRLEELMEYIDNEQVQQRFLTMKVQKKVELAKYIEKHNNVIIDTDSIVDVQIKRLHGYKRQLLNIMHIMHLYLEIKNNPEFTMEPRTFIFGAKAAPSYFFAKKVIKLITSVASTVNNDEVASKFMKVVFVENYGVTIAEKIIPAADVSEQISTAGLEASGTGNMKFMMNGAITLGTMDGANVEIHELVGDNHCEIFGLREDEIEELHRQNDYRSWDYYHNDIRIKYVVDSLLTGVWGTSPEEFRIIFEELMNHNDQYLILRDFDSYIKAQKNIEKRYKNQKEWAKSCLVNIAKSGFFSSDRTIKEYVDKIWHIQTIDK